MPLRGSPLILLFAAVTGLLAVHTCIQLGGFMREAAVAFCAFALMIGAPVAILVWFGSLSDQEAKRRSRHRREWTQKADDILWRRTLLDLQNSSVYPQYETAPSVFASNSPNKGFAPTQSVAAVASGPSVGTRARRFKKAILGQCVSVASAIGLMGCETVPPPMPMVQPGMGTAELVALVGGPDYIRSNGPVEVWQYCRDFGQRLPWRDEGRNAKYYAAVLVDHDQVKEVRPYAVYSDAGCKDFYRAEF